MDHKIRTILIDDEPKAISILQTMLERYCPEISIIATTQDSEKAVRLIEDMKPGLIFLDIAMPQMNGFQLLENFQNPDFEIIFATVFDNYAIDAINHCAIGYILKPVDFEELKSSVARAKESIQKKWGLQKNQLLMENINEPIHQNKKIAIPNRDGLEFVKIKDIVHCEGIDGYTQIHFQNRKSILSSQSIGNYVKLLENYNFFHAHKSHLINLNFVSNFMNEGYVVLENGSKVPISKYKKAEFLSVMKN